MLERVQMQGHFVGTPLLISLLLVNICWAYSSAEVDFSKSDKIDVHWSTGHCDSILKKFSRHYVISPQIHQYKQKSAIYSTLNTKNGLHHSPITLSYYHQGQHVNIYLHRNDHLLPREHFLTYQNSDIHEGYVVQNFTGTEVALCHYQGSILGIPESRAAISTCNGGINGIVSDGMETFIIYSGCGKSLQDKHYLFRYSDQLSDIKTCGFKRDFNDYNKNLLNDFLKPNEKVSIGGLKTLNRNNHLKNNRILRYKRFKDQSNDIRGPDSADKHSSYLELVIVVDKEVYMYFDQSTDQVHQYCKDLVNIINAVYNRLNIFIVLVGVVIWSKSNEIEITSNAVITLNNFLDYRRTKLVLEHPNDNAQLLTMQKFTDGVVGKAYLSTICTHENSGGVISLHSHIMAVVATTMAHEMGHNFGMDHDESNDYCKCQEERCIMSGLSTSVVPVHWSSCSIDLLNIAFSRGFNYCLRNKPSKLFDSPQCGNGFVEPGEQCDCGLPNYCQNTCCDPYTCKLYTNATCATGDCCDLSTCQPKQAGTVCRVGENECDLSEYCTGASEYCPLDVFKRDTVECNDGQAYCFEGQCRSHAQQCRILWGSTGVSSEHCYAQNTKGSRIGNCGYNRLNKTFNACEVADVDCGMLHCRHLSERLDFGIESVAVLSNSWINHERAAVPCSTALLDLDLQSIDPGLAPNGAKCGVHKMCLNQKCREVEQLRAIGIGKACPEQCNDNGVCNNHGKCHCDIGYIGETCLASGSGGSLDSGPATNPSIRGVVQRLMLVVFALMCFMATFCYLLSYCRCHVVVKRDNLIENMHVESSLEVSSFSSTTLTSPKVSGDQCPTKTTTATNSGLSTLNIN